MLVVSNRCLPTASRVAPRSDERRHSPPSARVNGHAPGPCSKDKSRVHLNAAASDDLPCAREKQTPRRSLDLPAIRFARARTAPRFRDACPSPRRPDKLERQRRARSCPLHGADQLNQFSLGKSSKATQPAAVAQQDLNAAAARGQRCRRAPRDRLDR